MEKKGSGKGDDEAPVALPPMDFSTLVLSMASAAMMHLGRIPSPSGEPAEIDLDAAKQSIDILAILEEKTRGNLDDGEQKLLRSLLYDLRVAFVDAQKQRA